MQGLSLWRLAVPAEALGVVPEANLWWKRLAAHMCTWFDKGSIVVMMRWQLRSTPIAQVTCRWCSGSHGSVRGSPLCSAAQQRCC